MKIVLIVLAVAVLAIFFFRNVAKEKAQIRENERKAREQAEARERARLEKERSEQEYQRAKEQKENAIQAAINACPGSGIYRLDHQEYEMHAATLNITEFTPISKDRFVAFDLETTGLNNANDTIVEIGAVRVENGQITAEYQQLVNPGYSIPQKAAAVNHITDEMLAGQPMIYEVLPSFLKFVGDDVLAAHNVQFDAKFLGQACMRNRFKIPERFFDTMLLARYWPDAQSKKLTSLIAEAGIKNDSAHRALGDARAVAQLILATNEKRKTKKVKADE